MRYEAESIHVTPPTGGDQAVGEGSSTIDRCAAVAVSITTTSTGVITLPACSWVEFTANVDCAIRFWKDNTLGPAVTTDFPIWQYAYKQWVCDGYLYFRARAISTPGTLFYAASAR